MTKTIAAPYAIATLKSGGPKMTLLNFVEGVAANLPRQIEAMWHDEAGVLHRHSFPEGALNIEADGAEVNEHEAEERDREALADAERQNAVDRRAQLAQSYDEPAPDQLRQRPGFEDPQA